MSKWSQRHTCASEMFLIINVDWYWYLHYFAISYFLSQEAASAGAKLLCFPENFSFVGDLEGESLKIAEPLDGPIMKGYCSLARCDHEREVGFLSI